MKILIDMQGVQTDSRHRGIGRYCFAVTQAFLEASRHSHETTLLFNAALDGVDEAIEVFSNASEKVRRRAVGPIRNTSSDNRINDARRSAAEHVFTHSLNAVNADVVWLGSVVEGFADDALVPHSSPDALTVATLYDLIPLHDPEYLGHARAREWYMRRIEVLKRCDVLLAISEWVRRDAIDQLGLDPDRIVSIGAGVDCRFIPPSPGTDHTAYLREKFGITRPFVMYNGGFDKRKNVVALVEAYASLPVALREKHVLVIAGRIGPLLAERFAEIMATLRLGPDDVVFTGFVSDDDLVRLYQTCAVFVFPSEREGFGLPPLEAMACGAPTLVNDVTSLPEVVGEPEALFDASAPGAMAARMEAVLSDAALATRLRHSGLNRALQYTWDAVANRALTTMESHASRSRRHRKVTAPSGLLSLPVYRVNAANVATTLPSLRQWPGHVLWSGPLPDEGPSAPADRYRLGGYARLRDEGHSTDWLALLEQDAIGVIQDDGVSEDILTAHLDNLRGTHPLARQRAVERVISTGIAPSLSDDDLACVADALVRATPGQYTQWLVDVTHIASNDLGTGVHRVVRSILREWLLHPPEHVRVEPIAFRDGRFHYAHDYACQLVGVEVAEHMPWDLVAITGNEVYIGLDWTMESLPSSAALLRTWRRAGVPLHFVVYDLLPLTMPEAFHGQSRESFARWMETIAGLGDVLHCISRTTANEVARWLEGHNSISSPAIMTFELGADADTAREDGKLEAVLSEAMAIRPSLLMVGTLEPRKGHAQVLEALELLWESGADVNLVIVGHHGWLVKDLVRRLEGHPERGKRLFWLNKADDRTLEAVYRRATALVAASYGEGYGLPLIEAAQRGKPVIARSLPVFHEIVGEYPSYFDTEGADGLATHIARWLAHRPPSGARPVRRTWSQSAALLQHAVMSFNHTNTVFR